MSPPEQAAVKATMARTENDIIAELRKASYLATLTFGLEYLHDHASSRLRYSARYRKGTVATKRQLQAGSSLPLA